LHQLAAVNLFQSDLERLLSKMAEGTARYVSIFGVAVWKGLLDLAVSVPACSGTAAEEGGLALAFAAGVTQADRLSSP
jgi:hypothetical protein